MIAVDEVEARASRKSLRDRVLLVNSHIVPTDMWQSQARSLRIDAISTTPGIHPSP